jgi:hypothetical protein
VNPTNNLNASTTLGSSRRGAVDSAYAIAEAERHVEGEQRGRLAELLKGVRVVSDVPTQELPEACCSEAKMSPFSPPLLRRERRT